MFNLFSFVENFRDKTEEKFYNCHIVFITSEKVPSLLAGKLITELGKPKRNIKLNKITICAEKKEDTIFFDTSANVKDG